jgi:hypothetical protein
MIDSVPRTKRCIVKPGARVDGKAIIHWENRHPSTAATVMRVPPTMTVAAVDELCLLALRRWFAVDSGSGLHE